ncbi:MAG: insulinase family protein [Lentisphaerae bacterium]|nr:insulinase family protein [Lentisphaerota bacterium]
MLKDVRLTRLNNGLMVATAPQPDAESAGVGIWIRVGGRYESRETTGASHFIEHLLFKGTPTRSAQAISQAIEGRGGYLNAYTQEENTCYYARLPHEYQFEAFDVLADMYLHAKLAPGDVDRERAVILEELKMYRDQPQAVVQEQLAEAVWAGHPIGVPLAGNERSLAGLTRDALDAFRRTHYLPGRTIVAFAGRVDHDACVARVEHTLARLRGGGAARFRPVTAKTRQEKIRLTRREIEQVHAAIGFRIPFSRHDRRRVALRMLNTLLGENMSSRLFQVVRERHGLAYSIHSTYQLFDDTGVLVIAAGLDSARADHATRLIAREIVRVREKAVGAAELRRTKDYLLGSFRLGLEGTGGQLSWVGESLAQYGRLLDPDEFIDLVRSTSSEDVRAVAETVFDPQRMTLSLVVPQKHPLDEAAWLKTLR